ncbi:MAG: efflux RND transporter periplasmic adaptor subunit [Gammaproteobacteria bacterium]|nr:efflux RND transporter periplasmic adaptor subunit [Gammaproteobacteria bacterium]
MIAAIGMAAFPATVRAQDDFPVMPPARVEIAIAELRDMAPVVDVPGTVVSLNDSRIAAEIEGVLTSLANVGDAVERGAVIARIDPRLMQVQLTRARANVAGLEAELRYRRQQLERVEELAVNDNAAANFLDETIAARDQALHQLADARAQLERAVGDLERTEIRAAFAGHVTERLASVGEYVDVGEDVLRLVDTHRIEITLLAPIALTAFVRPGLQVRVSNGDVERLHRVRAVVPVGDAVSRMVEIRLSADDGDWLVGTPVKVSLPSATPVTAVAVPRDALVERGGESFVYKVTDEGTAEQINANIQSTVGLWVGIADGIESGDQVIIRGGERLAPGQEVEVIPSAGVASQ